MPVGVLLCSCDTWTLRRDVARKLEIFHSKCLKGILGITSYNTEVKLSSVQIARHFEIWRSHWRASFQPGE